MFPHRRQVDRWSMNLRDPALTLVYSQVDNIR